MARRFRGEYTQKVDGKGRISIPANFRRVLESGDPGWSEGKTPEFVIVYGDERRNYLECYTMEAIDEVDEKIAAMKRGSPKRKLLERLFSGQSLPTSVDDTGRIVIPAKLREKISLKGEAFMIAMGDTFQIWNPEEHDAEDAAKTEALLKEMPEDFDILDLLDE